MPDLMILLEVAIKASRGNKHFLVLGDSADVQDREKL